MPDVSTLNHEEKVFLAGCIKTTIMADGEIEESELGDLNRIYERLAFHDYEERLQEFEEAVSDREGFYEAARAIDNPEAQDLILAVIYEIAHHSGAPNKSQELLFDELRKLWSKG